jgi:hypothetical protein
MTLKELYAKAKEQPKPDTPALAFVREIAAVTKKSEIAVRRWLSDGGPEPDALTKEVLASHFGTTSDQLFPKA